MNKAITDGIAFMPTAFEFGLGHWSSQDGLTGQTTYDTVPNAVFVPADQDFGGCLELVKTQSVQKLRFTGETPLLPGCYLRLRARVKLLGGAFPSVRMAGWAGGAGGAHVTGLNEAGASVLLQSYGDVVEISAIVGPGARSGVDMVWGTEPIFGHFGLDLTGPNGGVLRIDDLVIEDITHVFHQQMMNWIDVRDYGARGDGYTNDTAAFRAADAAAAGRRVLVPGGVFHIADHLTMSAPVQFEGRLDMPPGKVLSLTKSFDLPTYIAAFADEELAFRKAFQALLNNADHESLDMGGRRISIRAPLDMHAAVGNKSQYAQRRVVRNGQFYAEAGAGWDPEVITSQATYSASDARHLTNVANIAAIPVGALVQGQGVGREVYVRAVDVSAGKLTLSAPLFDGEGTQNFTFTRNKYMLDFSGFDKLSKFILDDVELDCNNIANGVMLAPEGLIFHMRDCVINGPAKRGLTSIGEGCQGMLVDRCHFLSHEAALRVSEREGIALNANANDVKLRNNRATQFRHFAVLAGGNLMISGNHFFQGDAEAAGIRAGGLVLTRNYSGSTITGNYIDNCFIEWTNEHDATPDFTGGFSFSALSITGNIFLTSDVAPWVGCIVVKPHGSGHFLNGLTVSGNMFRCVGATIDRVDLVDTSFAALDTGRFDNITFENNTYNQVRAKTASPLHVKHQQSGAAQTWDVDTGGELPFGGRARRVSALVPATSIRTPGNVRRYVMPYPVLGQGQDGRGIKLKWPEALHGTMAATIHADG